MSKKIKRQLIILACMIAIFIIGIIMIPFYSKYSHKKFEQEEKRRRINMVAESIESSLNYSLGKYTISENMIAIAGTDEKICAYQSADEILDVVKELKYGKNNNSYWDYGETTLEAFLPDKYFSFIEDRKNEGYKYWVLIEGNSKEGFIAEVKYAKDDPFQKERLHDK